MYNFDFFACADRKHNNFSQSIREMDVKIIFSAFLSEKHLGIFLSTEEEKTGVL